MTKFDYELVERLEKIGYDASISIEKKGFLLTIKKTPDEKKNGSAHNITTEPIGLAQNFGYKLEEIVATPYEKGTNDTIVPCLLLLKPYS